MEEKKPFFKKYWWVIAGILFLFWIIGKNTPEATTTRDYVAESNLLYEKILNPENMDNLTADYQKAEQLFSEMQQLKDSSDLFLTAKDQMEAVTKFKEQNLKSAQQKIKLNNLQDKIYGGFKVINKAIKLQMNDPSSFEHVNTEYKVKDNKIIAYTEYRGKNAFNATVLGNVMSVLDFEGNVLEFKAGN